MQNVGRKIRKLRKSHQDTLKELARKISYDYSNLSKVENGKYEPSLDLLKKITQVYQVSPLYFFEEMEEEEELEQNEYTLTEEKAPFVIDGIPVTEEEMNLAIQIIRFIRTGTLNRKNTDRYLE
ncbi:helix-turn-helix transcriptional regulator [Neobacillus sp. YIM B02564]|uniref:Helix-turn-helix transcriptional regulator n=1 Tax=Neobacillus paridis TaxID=2803862 RepID=A0ABS1TL73_9BACI|nr:helix-turn-helix transcriptional regulator [Neobacillus paridis]MBL4952070.1 helix-turn-helix transcriptional regulator [Neobacillus paridis]